MTKHDNIMQNAIINGAEPTTPEPFYLRLPEPMADDEIEGICWTEMDRRLLSFARAVEAEYNAARGIT